MTTTLRWLRLSYRLQRLEIVILAAAVALVSGLMAWSAFELDGIMTANPDCNFMDPSLACQAAGQRFQEVFGRAELIIGNTWLAGFGVGLILGVPLVAREVDHGTAQLAWTLGRSRVRWLAGRVAFAGLVGIVLLAVVAVATEVLAAEMRPELDTSQDFWLHGNRGPLVVGRGMLGLGAGVLVGALVGKQLPALLLGALAVGALYAASWAGFPLWYANEAVVASQSQWLGGPLWIESGIELTSGERVTWAELYGGGHGTTWDLAYMTEDGAYYASQADAESGRNPIGRQYALIIPGARYNEIVLRESAVFTVAGFVLVAGAAVVTRRRRPT
ncbi:MAG TPA: hypothetical protein VHK63_02960 [Candidatus Limnocylindria bacterium]|nr:hypothetical protein [Candidatus Limnocylindria bacterium]